MVSHHTIKKETSSRCPLQNLYYTYGYNIRTCLKISQKSCSTNKSQAGSMTTSTLCLYWIMPINSAFVKNLANSKSDAAFLAKEGFLATAAFKLEITIDALFVRAPRTAIR